MSKKVFNVFSILCFALVLCFIGCTELINPKTETDINLNIDLSKIIKSTRNTEETQSSASIGENPTIKVAIYDAKKYNATTNSTDILDLITEAQAKIVNNEAKVKLNNIPVGIDAIVFAELSFSNGNSTEVMYAGNSEVFRVKPTDNKVSLVLMKVGNSEIYPDDKEDVLKEQVASVVISPTSGDVSLGTIVTLSCSTENSSIFYKVGEKSDYQEYTEDTKIEITTETTIFAYAICEGMLDSEITQASYNLYQYTLNFDTDGGTSVESNVIYFDGATINLEGFSTTKENMEFDGWFTREDFSGSSITSITFSQNFEFLNKEDNSITLYAKFRDKNKVASVVISPASGDVDFGTIVTLSCATENSSIFYNVGETSGYQEYTEDTKIEITTETTIFAYAICEGMLDSEITQASYSVPKSNITVTFPSYTDVEGLTIEFDEYDSTCSPRIPAGYEFVAWYVDGKICSSDDNILNYGDFNVGSHTIMLVVKYTDGNLYSVEAILKINEE